MFYEGDRAIKTESDRAFQETCLMVSLSYGKMLLVLVGLKLEEDLCLIIFKLKKLIQHSLKLF